ncbi:hypothetical protein ACIA8K_09990 [Catenuloplanes sp. NPDC051500]|uniref:hypothetical protein n=1 Tax=Catenuloplanes sp. NPDC051500 TaxID=3363959 RepID=UPI0037AACA44
MTAVRTLLVTTGLAALAYAAFGLLTDPGSRPVGIAVFLAAVLVAHDLIWLPLVLAAGALISRFVPARGRPVIRALLLTAAAVAAVALPLLLSPGRPPGPATHLALPAAAVVAAIAVLWAVLPRRKKSESSAAADPGPGPG